MNQPPAFGRFLLWLLHPGDRRAEIEADLSELFELRTAQRGRAFARRRYVLDAMSLWKIRRSPSVIVDDRSHGGVDSMTHDIVFTFRLFRRHAGLFSVTIAGLAVAIGLSAAVFSVVKAVAFAGYGISPDEPVYGVSLLNGTFTRVTGNSPMTGNWAFSDYARLRDEVSGISLVAAATDGGRYRARYGDEPGVPVNYRAVSGDYFAVLGMRAALGRTLLPADDRAPLRIAVVSHGFWMNVLSGDRAILGKTVWLDDDEFTIVGVIDRRHSTPSVAGGAPAFWISLAAHADAWTTRRAAEATRTRLLLEARNTGGPVSAADRERLADVARELAMPAPAWNPAVDVIGRLKLGLSRPQAEAQVLARASTLAAEASSKQTPVVRLDPPVSRSADTLAVAATLLTIVALVVLLACANVTNVLLASAAGRRREIGTRLAIGASRVRILRQLLTESVLLGIAGSVVGSLIAPAIVPVLASFMHVPNAVDVSPDPGVYAFVVCMTIVVGVLAGLAPARYGYRGDITSSLTADQHSAPLPLPRARLRSLLVGGQAAISAVLLVLAALLTRALVDNVFVDVGYDVNRLVTVSVNTPGAPRTFDQYDVYWGQMRAEVLGISGVAGAAFASMPPFDGSSASQRFNGVAVSRNDTTPEYFDTVGIRTIRGRVYTVDEMRTGAPVVVISASLARAFWGDDDPLGASMDRVWGPVSRADVERPAGLLRKVQDARVIGVVADATTNLEKRNSPTIYLPLSEHVVPRLVVRADANPWSLARPLRDAVQSFDPRQRPGVALPQEGLRRQRERPRTLAILAILVGVVALGLATIGLFGVTAFVVEQRTHEMSVRRALGATNGQLVTLMLRDNLRPVAVGLAAGLAIAIAAGRVIESLLYGTSGRDPLALAAAVLVLATAAAVAVLVPARRAGSVDPARLLKQG